MLAACWSSFSNLVVIFSVSPQALVLPLLRAPTRLPSMGRSRSPGAPRRRESTSSCVSWCCCCRCCCCHCCCRCCCHCCCCRYYCDPCVRCLYRHLSRPCFLCRGCYLVTLQRRRGACEEMGQYYRVRLGHDRLSDFTSAVRNRSRYLAAWHHGMWPRVSRSRATNNSYNKAVVFLVLGLFAPFQQEARTRRGCLKFWT